MTLLLKASTFATISGQPHEAFLDIDGGAPILRVDAAMYNLLPTIQGKSIHGHLRAGGRYSCRPIRLLGDMGKTSIAVDDLIIYDGPTSDEPELLTAPESVTLFLDPLLVPNLSSPPEGTLPYFVHGRPLELPNIEDMESGGQKTSELDEPAVSLQGVRESALFVGAEREFVLSRQERIAIFLKVSENAPLAEYRKTVMALQLFFEMFLNPRAEYLVDVGLTFRHHGRDATDNLTPAEWWSQAIRTPPRLPTPGANVMPGGPAELDQTGTPARLDELGGYQALANWCRICLDLPHVLSSLLAYQRNLYLDSEAALISLAMSVEHLTAILPSNKNVPKSDRLANYVISKFGCDDRLRPMLKLVWKTYTKLKHRRPAGITVANDSFERDSEEMQIAADFTYSVVSAGLLACAGAKLPIDLMLELSDPELTGRHSDWQMYLHNMRK